MASEPIIYDFDARNLPSEYLRAIGLVIASASQTETVLQDFIGGLLQIDNIETKALTVHMSVPLKGDIIRALVELSAPSAEEVDKVDDLLDAVCDALQKRNNVAHNAFLIHPDTREILGWREKARGQLVGTLTPISAKEIEDDAASIYKAGMELFEFMLARGIAPDFREGPLRENLKRTQKARAERRNLRGGDRA
jgi:hypothetical protein